jgi:cytochrome c oxidase assembly protein subunit 15
VEWKPVTGMLPPLTDAQWTQAFEGYKTIRNIGNSTPA